MCTKIEQLCLLNSQIELWKTLEKQATLHRQKVSNSFKKHCRWWNFSFWMGRNSLWMLFHARFRRGKACLCCFHFICDFFQLYKFKLIKMLISFEKGVSRVKINARTFRIHTKQQINRLSPMRNGKKMITKIALSMSEQTRLVNKFLVV